MAADDVIRDFVCTACGCTCDDLVVTVTGDHIASFEPPCPVAASILLAERPASDNGDMAARIEQAAEFLQAARAPLVMGLARATVEAQRFAIAIADRLRGFLDPTDDWGTSASHIAAQTAGAVTATLGEVAQRADLVVYWECDPATTHPRHLDRFASRTGQRRIVVDHWPSPTAALADDYLLIPADSGATCLAALRAAVRGIAIDANAVEEQTGNSWDAWRELAAELKAAKYAAVFFDTASRGAPAPGGQSQCAIQEAKTQAIAALVRELHRHTRAVAIPLGAAWNAVGAAQVATWQTGFPGALSFARGYPQYLPGEATAAALLGRGEVDAVLVLAADPLPHLSPAAASYWRSIPTIVLDDRNTATRQGATIAIPVSPFGLETAGTTFRSDGVALPLTAAFTPHAQTATDVLQQLAERLASQPHPLAH
jgi:formylmethanofuran dehydrogenase subunit B